MKIALLIIYFFCIATLSQAQEKEFCIYADKSGVIKQTSSYASIPPNLQATAKCFKSGKSEYLAQPEEVKLTGNIRHEEMATAIGQIELRWPRKVELLFGRTPQKAMSDAAATASRALRAASFPPDVQNLNLNWKVVFMDEDLPETQIPRSLISNCHPAWMTPSANIYVVAQRVVAGCGGEKVTSKVADSELAHILLHEMGHAIEYKLLGNAQAGDRMRSEGFASWFEAYASNYSSVIPKGSVKDNYFMLAKEAIKHQPTFQFSGSAYDYARASMFFHAIVEKKGIRGLVDVYTEMKNKNLRFLAAVKERLQWDDKRMQEEIVKILN